MAAVDKLMIRGVRSFDPGVPSIIEFYTPLTIIVGHNGSGKTTIIECLKYATTGDLPPNSRGGAFIHDPRLSQSSETKAQIRLKFRNVGRQPLICTRSLQLTRRGNAATMRTLENLLVKIDPQNPEHQVSLSTRCADLDLEITHQLGVSRAILQNVIFCHQEDSNWPLAEPSALKKKFDEIFASSRYTKALDSIRSIRKDQTADIKLDQQHLSHLQQSRDKSERIRTHYLHAREKITLYQDQIANLQKSLKRIEEQRLGIIEEQKEMGNQEALYAELRHEQDIIASTLRHTEQSMTRMEETLEELLELQKDQENTTRNFQRDAKLAQRQMGTHEENIAQARLTVQKLYTTQGKLGSRQGDHKKNVEELARLLEASVVQDHSEDKITSSSSGTPPTAEDLVQQVNDLNTAYQRRTNECKHTKEANRTREQSLRTQVHKEEGLLSEHRQRKMAAGQQQLAVQRNQERTTALLRGKTAVEERKRTKNDHLKDLLAQKRSFDEADEETELSLLIAEKQHAVDEYQSKILRANQQLQALSSVADKRATLTYQQTELAKDQVNLAALDQDMVLAVQKDHPEVTTYGQVKDYLENTLEKLEGDLQVSECTVQTAAAALANQRTELGLVERHLQDSLSELADHMEKLTLHEVDEAVFSERLAEAELTVSDHQTSIARLQSESALYHVFLDETEKNQCCPVCDRGFDTPDDVATVLDTLRAKRGRAPEQLAHLQEQLSQHQAKCRALQALTPHWDAVRKLKSKGIPALQSKQEILNTQVAEADIHQQTMVHQLQNLKDRHRQLIDLSHMLKKRTSLADQVATLETKVAKLDQELTDSIGSHRTFDEYQSEIKEALDKKAALESDIKLHHQQLREHERRGQALQQQISDAKAQVEMANRELSDMRRYETEERMHSMELEKVQSELVEIDRAVTETSAQCAQIQTELEQHLDQSRTEEATLDEALAKLGNHLAQLTPYKTAIVQYLEDNVPTQMAQCQRDITEKEQYIKDQEGALAAVQTRFKDIERHCQNHEVYTKSIATNIEYHRLIQRKGEFTKKLEQTKTDLARYDAKALHDRLVQCDQQERSVNQKLAGLQGEIRQLDIQCRQYQHELENEFNDIEAKFRAQMIKCKTKELANEDLETYSKALDSAITKYHSIKMDEVNKIIHELWINTYQGNDIDTVEIRSDCETTRGNRSYSYRVVMIKNNTELDMRGRCSAGQRVLTCLLIRLALAETFGANCGILALDEPTTNLDRANIESLAESLSHIIRTRRQQNNFQLIVITHDEEFMELLGRSDHADYYWRVSKDINQHSRIERRAITSS
ncbi:DNA repair protein rad50 [Dispira parvispora]|uniref:DNA repair protein RAD50 n=1 Tax=Dispira parvispora TaxID=1520584 RepID=A0A9W8ASJ3_9FUNG|nr:DNA repair protein rad50 [Dispira parvispora]